MSRSAVVVAVLAALVVVAFLLWWPSALQAVQGHLNYAVYHDRYRRTPDGWMFVERVYEIRYLDTTPLAGSPHAASGGR